MAVRKIKAVVANPGEYAKVVELEKSATASTTR